MKALSLCLLALCSFVATAGDLTIFDVRRTLRLSDRDPVYHDYYINGGSEAGLSPGLVITITRKLPLYDSYQNHSAGDLLLKVARVKIIHVQKGLAVARLQSEFTRDNAPLLEDPFIMVGDSLDMSTATSDKKEASASRPTAPDSTTDMASQGTPVAQISINGEPPPPPNPAPVDAPALQ